MSRHTPGPWFACAYAVGQKDVGHEGDICYACHASDGENRGGQRPIPDSQALANARLLAAAPELAVALNRYLELYKIRPGDISVQSEWGQCYVECEAQARAALEKAGIFGEVPEFERILEDFESSRRKPEGGA